jgi:hypothetical protein
MKIVTLMYKSHNITWIEFYEIDQSYRTIFPLAFAAYSQSYSKAVPSVTYITPHATCC